MNIREKLRANRPEKVMIYLPIDKNKPETLYVGVNGKRYSIQRGKQVSVPWAVAQVIEQSEKSDLELMKKLRHMSDHPMVGML